MAHGRWQISRAAAGSGIWSTSCCGITLSRTREITGICWGFGFHLHVLGEFGLFRNTSAFGLMDDGGKAITFSFSEWTTLAQDRAGWLKLVTESRKCLLTLANRS